MNDTDHRSVVRARILVGGRVQGVFFRATACAEARALKLQGYVRNLPDGRVELVAEGPRPDVEALIRWCHKGPPNARVSEVKVAWHPPEGNLGPFDVTYR